MQKAASPSNRDGERHSLKHGEPERAAPQSLPRDATLSLRQARKLFGQTAGLQQLQVFFSLLDQPTALRRILLQHEALHEAFKGHIDRQVTPAGDNTATARRDLDQLIELSPLPIVLRFLFAHFLAEAGKELEAGDAPLNAIQRGRFLELLAEECSLDVSPENAYLAGGLCAIQEMTGVRLEDLLPLLQTPQQVNELLLAEPEQASDGFQLLNLARHIEAGDWSASQDVLAKFHLSGERVATLYGKAAIWTWMLLG